MQDRQGINGMVVSDYFDKQVDFSASDFTTPLYQLWVKKNFPKNTDEEQGFKPWVGQLIHDASYRHPEVNVIKEFSFVLHHDIDTSIGGSVDRCALDEYGVWHIEDLKSQGYFPASKSYKEPSDSWIKQLSIYKLGMESCGLKVSDTGVIHQYVLGYQKKKGSDMQEYNKIEILLMSEADTVDMINTGINVARNSLPPQNDCAKYLCSSYCSWNQNCPSYSQNNLGDI